MTRPNILVVCGRNKKRSRTAEHIFKNDSRFSIKSAGLSSKSEIQLNEKLVSWADLIFVMDSQQRNRINGEYIELNIPPIEILNIPDEYEYLNEELIELLQDGINGALIARFNI